MRIEIWSNTEYTTFMTGLLRELRAAGHDAVHRFQISNAQYRATRGRFARLWLRVRMYLAYPLQVLADFIFRRGPACSVVCTNTFFAPLLATFVAGRQRKVVHLVYDLFPDVLVHAGSIRRGGLTDRIIGFFTRMTFRRCAANVFLGRHLLEYAEKRYGKIPNAVIIPVGADGKPFLSTNGTNFHEPTTDGHTTMLYCGNFGRMHDYATLVEALKGFEGLRVSRFEGSSGGASASVPSNREPLTHCNRGPLDIRFHANGPSLGKLKIALGLPPDSTTAHPYPGVTVMFGGNLPDGEWEKVMRKAAVALVTMAPGAEEVVMPSKTYSAMVAGQAILAVCARHSDLADTVLSHDCGWVVEPGDAVGLQAALEEIQTRPDKVAEKRKNAYRAGHEHYDTAVVAKLWETLCGNAGMRECVNAGMR